MPHTLGIGRQFDGHMRKIVTVVMLPSLVSAAGALLFPRLALIQSLFFRQVGLMAGLAAAVRPPTESRE